MNQLLLELVRNCRKGRLPRNFKFDHERLRVVREEAGLTRDHLGTYMGVGYNAITSWEAGRTKPSMEHYRALTALFQENFIKQD